MTSVEVKDVGSFRVEDKSDWPFLCLLLLPHLPRDVITVTELVCETLTFTVE